jgi:hypothetical protein
MLPRPLRPPTGAPGRPGLPAAGPVRRACSAGSEFASTRQGGAKGARRADRWVGGSAAYTPVRPTPLPGNKNSAPGLHMFLLQTISGLYPQIRITDSLSDSDPDPKMYNLSKCFYFVIKTAEYSKMHADDLLFQKKMYFHIR